MLFFTRRQSVLFLMYCSLLIVLATFPLTKAQAAFTSSIAPDGTLGTTVTQTGKLYDINGGTIKGTNQFHSFGKLSIGTGDTASFNGPAGILNILSRVTGGQQSQIDGTIKSTIAGANLYLMNPAGVLFGPTASLNISGSFHVTTADYLRLMDSVRFNAVPGAAKDALLSTSPVVAFGFLSNSPAPISIQDSILTVRKTKSLSIIGGDITITGGDSGYLGAPGGQINIASIASPGEAALNAPGMPASLDVSSFSKLGLVQLLDSAYLDTGGTVVNGRITHGRQLVGGTVIIRGGQLIMDGSIIDSSTGNANAAPIGIDIQVSGDAHITNSTLISDTEGTGRAGNIVIKVGGGLSLAGGTLVTSDSNDTGRAGDIQISATNFMLNGLISNDANSSGPGGDITLTARDLFTIDDSIVTSSAQEAGNGGKIFITTPKLTMQDSLIQVLADFDGNAGDVTIAAGTITINNSVINSSTFFGSGLGGNVTITATQSVTMIGIPELGNGVFLEAGGSGNSGRVSVNTPLLVLDRSTLFASTDPGSTANAGHIILDVGQVTLKNGSTLESQTLGAGKGGNIDIVASNSLEILGPSDRTSFKGLSTSTQGSGDAGHVVVSTGELRMNQHAIISSDASLGSTGNAGTIDIHADTINLTNGAIISSGTFAMGHGGTLNLTATKSIGLSGTDDFGNPTIITSSTLGAGNAGLIAITTPSLALNPGVISTNAGAGSGNGGNVNVSVATLTLLNGGRIEAGTSTTGNSGDLTVTGSESITISGDSTTGLFTASLDPNAGSGTPIAPVLGKGGQLTVSTPVLSLSGSGQISAASFGNGDAGEIQIKNVGTLSMAGDSNIVSGTFLEGTRSNAGNITINVARAFLNENSTISTTTFTDGAAGTIILSATEVLSLTDRGAVLSVSGSPGFENGSGAAGHITVTTPKLVMTKGIFDVTTFSAGDAGGIELKVGEATLTNGAQISSDTFSAGRGGDITMIATGSVHFSGEAPDGKTSGLFSNAANGGNAGTVTLSAASLTMTDHAEIQSASAGAGKGGAVTIGADSIVFSSNARVFTGSKSTGAGGDIQLTGRQVALNSGGTISSSSSGPADAGAITIIAKDTFVSDNGLVSTEAQQGAGGNIVMHVGSLVNLQHSKITATVLTQTGDGGNITIDPPNIILNDSQIIAKAFAGHGGKITIDAGLFLASADSVVDASSAFGLNGTVNIESPVQNLSGTLSPLPSSLLKISPLTSACAARAQGGSFSSFTVAGRDGIPAEPGGLLPSPLSAVAPPPTIVRNQASPESAPTPLLAFALPSCPE